jgi:ribosomal protein S18 acetylase RimI-like enzyme
MDISENNYLEVCGLEVSEEQKRYVASPMRILASAYAMRNQNARVWAVTHDSVIVGVLMVKELVEEPACYTLEQFMIDYRYQGRGYGKQALKLVMNILAKERIYDSIEICVKMEDVRAIALYQKAGFMDTGYIDPSAPDSYVLKYTFA